MADSATALVHALMAYVEPLDPSHPNQPRALHLPLRTYWSSASVSPMPWYICLQQPSAYTASIRQRPNALYQPTSHIGLPPPISPPRAWAFRHPFAYRAVSTHRPPPPSAHNGLSSPLHLPPRSSMQSTRGLPPGPQPPVATSCAAAVLLPSSYGKQLQVQSGVCRLEASPCMVHHSVLLSGHNHT